MLIEIVRDHAAQTLLERLEQSSGAWGALHIECSRQQLVPDEEAVVFIAHHILDGRRATVYFFKDGDFIITWHGAQSATVNALRAQLCEKLHLAPDASFDHYYDSQAQGEELRMLCKRKMAAGAPAHAPHAATLTSGSLSFTEEQLAHMRKMKARPTLKQPSILIVEDQEFSRKLLEGMLRKNYACYVAANAKQAIALFAEHVPSITLLDIELPDTSGHDVAALIRKHQPRSYIVMVTANNYEKDVMIARENKVNGFIVKPYSKAKIQEAVDKYSHEQEKKS